MSVNDGLGDLGFSGACFILHAKLQQTFHVFLADEEQGGCLCRVQTIKRNHADEVLPRL